MQHSSSTASLCTAHACTLSSSRLAAGFWLFLLMFVSAGCVPQHTCARVFFVLNSVSTSCCVIEAGQAICTGTCVRKLHRIKQICKSRPSFVAAHQQQRMAPRGAVCCCTSTLSHTLLAEPHTLINPTHCKCTWPLQVPSKETCAVILPLVSTALVLLLPRLSAVALHTRTKATHATNATNTKPTGVMPAGWMHCDSHTTHQPKQS